MPAALLDAAAVAALLVLLAVAYLHPRGRVEATTVPAALVGLHVGSGHTYPGSLANLLGRRTLARHDEPPSGRDFHLLAVLVTPPAVTAAVVVLWAWTRALGR